MKIITGIVFYLITQLSSSMTCIDPEEIIYYSNPLLNRKCYWFDRVEGFKKANEHASIVFVGDSLVQGGKWNELLGNNDVANRGVGGNTTLLVLEIMDSILDVRATTAYTLVGINDFYRVSSVEEVFNHYKEIIAQLQEHNINVVILSTLHCNSALEPISCSAANRNISVLNEKLSMLPDIRFVDLNQALSENGELKKNYTKDGIHLNKDGYEIIGEILTRP